MLAPVAILSTARPGASEHHGQVLPDFVTHYFLPDRGPYSSLSDQASRS